MSLAPRTVGELIARLEAEGRLPPGAAEGIRTALSRDLAAPPTPWYVQALVGLSAWVAAIALVLAVGLAFFGTEATMIVSGLVFLGIGIAAHRGERGIFAAQASLALCFAGQACLLIGVGASMPSTTGTDGAFATAVLLAAGLYRLQRSPIHRFVSVLTAAVLGILWVHERTHFRGQDEQLARLGLDALIAIEAAAAVAILLLRDPPRALRPLAYALVVAVLGTLIVLVPDWGGDLVRSGWLAQLGLGAVLVGALARLAGGAHALAREPLSVVAAAAMALTFASNAGILAALAFLVIGYARGETLLVGLSLAFLPPFLVAYYYDLDVTLLRKSGILVASGCVLLGMRWFLSNRPWAREGKT